MFYCCVLNLYFTCCVPLRRSGLSRGPASHWSKGGFERPQTSEGDGELCLEHHCAQGEVHSDTLCVW